MIVLPVPDMVPPVQTKLSGTVTSPAPANSAASHAQVAAQQYLQWRIFPLITTSRPVPPMERRY